MILDEKAYWDAKGQDPISSGECAVVSDGRLPDIDYEDPSFLEVSANIIISNRENNPFFIRIVNFPLKLQGQPLVLTIGSEKFLVNIQRVERFRYNEDRTEICLEGAKLRVVDNLNFVKHVQEYRWQYPERKK